jgi:ADP-heptose:LPS heptosyltransferase
MSYPKRLVIARFSAMGDVALMVPVILALRKKYPDVEVFTLSRKRNNEILKQIDGVRVLEAQLETNHRGVAGMYRLAKKLKDLEIDALADMHNVIRTKMLRTFLGGVKKAVIDKGRKEKKKLVSDKDFFRPLKHTTERYLEVLRNLGYDLKLDGDEQLPELPMPLELASRLHLDGFQLVGLAPFAAHKTKAFSVKKARRLVEALSADKNITVVLIGGGKKECKKLQVVAGTTAHVVNLAGTTTFNNELAVISNLDLMIAMDSGNGHIAAAYGVPVITVWGNTHPYAGFAPFGQPEENQLIASRDKYPLIPTSIYGNKKVKGYQKVTCSVKVKDIFNRVNEILYNQPSAEIKHE